MVSNFLLVQKPNCRLRQDRLVGRQIPRKWLFRVELESASRAGRYFPTEEVARYQSVIATAQLMKSVPNKNRMFVSTARNALFLRARILISHLVIFWSHKLLIFTCIHDLRTS